MANKQSAGGFISSEAYTGNDRRTGLERRSETSKATTAKPRLHSAVALAGVGTFVPGQEKEFFDAANTANENAEKAKQSVAVDFDALEKRGVLSGFGQARAKSGDKGENAAPQGATRTTRGVQLERGKDGYNEVEVAPGHAAAGAGQLPFDEVNPVPPEVSGTRQGPTAAEISGDTGARTGGAGRTGTTGRTATGERARAEK